MRPLTRQNRRDLHCALLAYKHCGYVRLIDVFDLGVTTQDKSWLLEEFRLAFNVPEWRQYGDWDGQHFQAGRVDFDAMMEDIANHYDCTPADLLLELEGV